MENNNTKHFYNCSIPSDWEVKSLGQLGEILSGLTYSPANIREAGTLVLRSSNIQERVLCFDDNVYVDVDEKDYKPVLENDILICVRNGSKSLIGKNALITKDVNNCAFGAFMAIFRSEYNSYLHQLFDTDFYKREVHRNLGATINSINGSDLKKFKFPLPPLPEQKAIAKALSLMDTAINKNNQLIAQKELSKKWLMQNLLTGKKRLKGFSEEWKKVRIDDVTTNFSRRNKELIDANIYSVTNTNGFVLQTDHFEGRVAGQDLSNYKIIKKNEFAYNPARINVGSLAYFEDEIGVISSLYVCFKTKKEILDYYLQQFLQLDHTKYRINALGEGGVRVYLWYDLFSKIKINLPSIEEQTAIAKVFQAADKELELLKAKTDKLREQKKGMMQVLLTGKKRLNCDLCD